MVSEEMKEQFAFMRKRWKNIAVGTLDLEITPELLDDSHVKSYITKISNEASKLYESMNKTDERTCLWEKESSITFSSDLSTQFQKLNSLAKAYGTKGADQYKNEELLDTIVSGLEFMTQEKLYYGNKYCGNWWDWQIGVPQQFTTTLMIIYDDIDRELIDKYVAIMSKYLPDPYQQLLGQPQDTLVYLKFLHNFKNSGANRTDQAISYLGLGLLIEDSEMIHTAVESIGEIFEIVNSGDGFYEDGSFIQHYHIPYVGGYGNQLVKGVGDIFAIVSGTQWQIEETKLIRFAKNVKDAFIPLIFHGETMSMVSGRSISRPYVLKNECIVHLLITHEVACNEEHKQLFQKAAKYWLVKNPDYFIKRAKNFKDLLLTKAIMKDTTITCRTKPISGSRMYGAMDRFVYNDNDISLGISLHSKRISAFEAGNKENKKAWHTSDGMVYLYNSDPQFSITYWPTVDWYRLPGTTIDTVSLEDELTSFKSFRSPEDFVGGATDGKDAVVSMQLNKNGIKNNHERTEMNLKAKKSWFVFNGKIICLGTDISGTTSYTIETVIENRLLDPSSTYTFVDQTGEEASTTETHEASACDWYLLKSSEENQSIGYVMLDGQIIRTQQEERSGTYKEINDAYQHDAVYTGTYQKILIEHGNDVTDGQYAYLIYPSATEDQLDAVVNKNTYSILSNTAGVQAVKDNQRRQLGVTIWNETGGTIEGIKVNQAATFLYSEGEDDQVTLSFSNPKQTNVVIRVELPQEITDVIMQDKGISVDGNNIFVDTTGALGKTFQITVTVAPRDEE